MKRMATLTFTFDTKTTPISKITDSFVSVYGYRSMIPNPINPNLLVPNPETPLQFTTRQVGRFIVETVKTTDKNNAIATVTEISIK